MSQDPLGDYYARELCDGPLGTDEGPHPHWTVAYRAWVESRADIMALGLIKQMEAYLKEFPHTP